jgi:hypothetical protein
MEIDIAADAITIRRTKGCISFISPDLIIYFTSPSSYLREVLSEYDKIERLNFKSKAKIRERLKGASKGYFPINVENIKEENKALCDILQGR